MAAPSPGPLPRNVSPSLAWNIQQDKLFEQALAMYEDDTPSRWEKIAARVPGKDAAQARKHYELLVDDVSCIEAGRIALPNYNSCSSWEGCSDKAGIGGDISSPKKSSSLYAGQKPSIGGVNISGSKGSAKSPDTERKKGVPWSENEHRLFLLGLDKYGKGDWRSISRNFVITRTPTQVASHAQKYFLRLNSNNKDNKRRSSIHDITSVNNSENTQPGQAGPITSQTSAGAASCSSPIAQSLPHTTSPSISLSRPPLYVPPAVGQPIGSPIGSDVGTPVLLSSPPPFPSRPPPPLLGRSMMSPSPLPISASRPGHSAFSVPQSAMHQLSGQG